MVATHLFFAAVLLNTAFCLPNKTVTTGGNSDIYKLEESEYEIEIDGRSCQLKDGKLYSNGAYQRQANSHDVKQFKDYIRQEQERLDSSSPFEFPSFGGGVGRSVSSTDVRPGRTTSFKRTSREETFRSGSSNDLPNLFRFKSNFHDDFEREAQEMRRRRDEFHQEAIRRFQEKSKEMDRRREEFHRDAQRQFEERSREMNRRQNEFRHETHCEFQEKSSETEHRQEEFHREKQCHFREQPRDKFFEDFSSFWPFGDHAPIQATTPKATAGPSGQATGSRKSKLPDFCYE